MNRELCSYLRKPHGNHRHPLSKFHYNSSFRPNTGTNVTNKLFTNWRRSTSTVGVQKSGFIDLAPGEGLLFFDNVYPLKTAAYDIRHLIMRYDRQSIESRIRAQCIPKNLLNSDFTITDIVPRLKDGGAFVKFQAPDPAHVETAIARYLKEKGLKPWFSPFRRVKAYAVRGKPWLEDLYRFPSARLKVEFIGGEGEGGAAGLSQEVVYALFRRYGKIVDIFPQAPGSKELPKFTIVQYLRMRSATAARNCLHGYAVSEIKAAPGKEGNVTLRILYERTIKVRWIRDWLVNHPRIVIPLAAALIATFTVAIFDPVRTWFVKAKITGALRFSDNTYYNWLKRHTIGMLPIGGGGRRGDMGDLWAVWDERKEQVEQLKAWLLETAETFIAVQGPRGSGKRDLVVDTVLVGRENVLIIDCEPIIEANGDSATIAAAASQVGYRPVFSWLNAISSLLDLAAQGTIGSSAGFSQTLETQLNKILQNAGTALKAVALRDKDQYLSDDEYLSAHPEKRPVVVIDNFLHMKGDSIIYERLAAWAAFLVSSNVAHVIFLTNDTSFSKSLSKSLPDGVIRSLLLGDAQPESAKRFVLKHLNSDADVDISFAEKSQSELDDSIAALGGRLTDLESLARRIRAGEAPAQAVHEIIETAANEILKLYFLQDAGSGDGAGAGGKRTWTPEHAWHLVKLLSSAPAGEARYNQVLVHDLFKRGGEDALQGLEQAELVSVVSRGGRPWSVRPGRPVYLAAFRRLLKDQVLCARMDLAGLTALCAVEVGIIRTAEDELEKIAAVPGPPRGRVAYLVRKIEDAQKRVEEYERGMGKLKRVLREEF